MAKYVDGFVIPLSRRDVAAYTRLARLGRRVWMKHGALQYFECVAEDLSVHPGCGPGFEKGVRLRRGETVAFSFIVYRSRAQRDAVNAKVMKDPAMRRMPRRMPFDMDRLLHGGFQVIVEG